MSRPQLRARSATEIVDAAFQLYRRDPLTYLLLSAICYAPILVIQLLVFGPAMTMGPDQLSTLSSASTLVVVFGYWISLSLLSAVLIRLSSEDYLGREIEPSVAVRDALLRLPAVMFGLLFKYLFIFIGFLLLFFPALWVIARYFAVTSSIVLEGIGVVAAFGRSARLSRTRKLHILGTQLLAFLIFVILYFAVVMIAAFTSSVVVSTVLGAVASILAYPLFVITEMLLYYDARVRAEGYDIELMEAGLGDAGDAGDAYAPNDARGGVEGGERSV